jgi:hypothetical protein
LEKSYGFVVRDEDQNTFRESAIAWGSRFKQKMHRLSLHRHTGTIRSNQEDLEKPYTGEPEGSTMFAGAERSAIDLTVSSRSRSDYSPDQIKRQPNEDIKDAGGLAHSPDIQSAFMEELEEQHTTESTKTYSTDSSYGIATLPYLDGRTREQAIDPADESAVSASQPDLLVAPIADDGRHKPEATAHSVRSSSDTSSRAKD